MSLVPDEPTPQGGGSGAGRAFSQRNYGMDTFADLFNARQALALTTLAQHVREAGKKLSKEYEQEFADAVQTCLAIVVNRQADKLSSLSRWDSSRENSQGTFARQVLPIVWDFNEVNPFSGSGGDWNTALDWVVLILQQVYGVHGQQAHVERLSAAEHALPYDSIQAFITDPPYYDAVPYSDLSDFFYVWFKRTLPISAASSFTEMLTPKDDECIVDEVKGKDRAYFEQTMAKAMAEGRRILQPSGIGVVVFAHKSTSGWEAQLQAMVDAGWTMTGSWAIDTEMGSRLRAQNSAALASSVHLVCRPRENPDGTLQNTIGDWRDVLHELPVRIHEWMPRLVKDGVVGADAIFACLGPALEIFSRYAAVEKANGVKVPLKEYLEHVWAAVAKEAFNSIFDGADATGFEEDARLTAIWFWTMKEAANTNGDHIDASELDTDDDSFEKSIPADAKKTSQGYTMEYDAIRKLAQGLGVNLDKLSQQSGIITIKGNTAVLNSVTNRATYLLGRQLSFFEGQAEKHSRKRQESLPVAQLKAVKQRQGHIYDPQPTLKFSNLDQPLFPELNQEDTRNLLERLLENGSTMLDRLHQSMLLFAHSHSTLLRSLLMETRFADDPQFWRLAQALLSLYPNGSDEKRWVEGVLSRKKSLGF